MRASVWVALWASLWVAGCATPASQEFQGGFQDTRESADTFWVSFEGNVRLDAQALEQTLLRHAAELTLQEGFTHFEVLARSRQSGIGFALRPDRIGPARHVERALRIRCYRGATGPVGTIDAQAFLDSPDGQDFSQPKRPIL